MEALIIISSLIFIIVFFVLVRSVILLNKNVKTLLKLHLLQNSKDSLEFWTHDFTEGYLVGLEQELYPDHSAALYAYMRAHKLLMKKVQSSNEPAIYDNYKKLIEDKIRALGGKLES